MFNFLKSPPVAVYVSDWIDMNMTDVSDSVTGIWLTPAWENMTDGKSATTAWRRLRGLHCILTWTLKNNEAKSASKKHNTTKTFVTVLDQFFRGAWLQVMWSRACSGAFDVWLEMTGWRVEWQLSVEFAAIVFAVESVQCCCLLSLVESSRGKTCVRTYLHALLICFNFVSVNFNKTVFVTRIRVLSLAVTMLFCDTSSFDLWLQGRIHLRGRFCHAHYGDLNFFMKRRFCHIGGDIFLGWGDFVSLYFRPLSRQIFERRDIISVTPASN